MSRDAPHPEGATGGLSGQSIEAELRQLEEALLDPEMRRNRAYVASLLTDDMVEFGASGRIWTRDELLDLLAAETISPQKIEWFNCHVLAEGIALVTYRVIGVDQETGAPKSSLRSSIWIKEFTRWRLRFHQGTRQP